MVNSNSFWLKEHTHPHTHTHTRQKPFKQVNNSFVFVFAFVSINLIIIDILLSFGLLAIGWEHCFCYNCILLALVVFVGNWHHSATGDSWSINVFRISWALSAFAHFSTSFIIKLSNLFCSRFCFCWFYLIFCFLFFFIAAAP